MTVGGQFEQQGQQHELHVGFGRARKTTLKFPWVERPTFRGCARGQVEIRIVAQQGCTKCGKARAQAAQEHQTHQRRARASRARARYRWVTGWRKGWAWSMTTRSPV